MHSERNDRGLLRISERMAIKREFLKFCGLFAALLPEAFPLPKIPWNFRPFLLS